MRTLEELKKSGKFYRKGQIVPNRILRLPKGEKKFRHHFTFGADTWIMGVSKSGYMIVFSDTQESGSILHIFVKSNRRVPLYGFSQMAKGVMWLGNRTCSDEELVVRIENVLTEQNQPTHGAKKRHHNEQ